VTKLVPAAQELVDAGRGFLRPNAGDKARVLAALQARLGTAPEPHAAPAPSPLATPVSAGRGGKLAAVAAGSVVLGALGYYFTRAGDAPVTKPLGVVASASAAPSSLAAPVLETPVASAESSPPSPSSSPLPSADASTARRPADRLGEEVSILSRAEAELHSGRFASALRLLDEHQRKFPNGKLSQERIAAKIQALCALGRSSDADAELARLAPDSVHEGRARAACSKTPSVNGR